MKADFEKGTKVCSKCKRELPISEFYKCKTWSDGLDYCCKRCAREKQKVAGKKYLDKTRNTFGKEKRCRGNSGMLLRDYELTYEQLKRRNKSREQKKCKNRMENVHGLLIWYDGLLNDLSTEEYERIQNRERSRQRLCAIRGYVGRTKPSEHFLFDFDLEQMLKDDVYYEVRSGRKHITKWWDGEIRHWTVNDGIWRK